MFFIMDAPLLAQSIAPEAAEMARLDSYKQELKRVARQMLGAGERS
jgi:hypothetical protein